MRRFYKMFLLLFGFYFFLGFTAVADAASMSLEFNQDSLSYTIHINDALWFTSGPTFFRTNGQLYSTEDGSLILISSSEDCGVDLLGEFTSLELVFVNKHGDRMHGIIRQYEAAIIFEQYFPKRLKVHNDKVNSL